MYHLEKMLQRKNALFVKESLSFGIGKQEPADFLFLGLSAEAEVNSVSHKKKLIGVNVRNAKKFDMITKVST